MTSWIVLRFHVSAGTRVALRNSAVGTAVAVFIIGMAPEPVALLRALAASIAARGVAPWALILLAVSGTALARQAVPQVAAAQAGWARSLPVRSGARQRAVVVALVLAQAPVLLFATGCIIAVALSQAQHVAISKVLSLIPGAIVTAMVGSVARPATTRRRWWRPAGRLPLRVNRRAVSWRVVPALLPAALPLALAWFYRVNNSDLSAGEASAAAQLGGMLGLTMTLAGLANALHARRPVWSWSRSLPWSARQRVVDDAMSLSLGLLPVLVVVAVMDRVALLRVVLVVPVLVLTAAGAMRRAGSRLASSAGEPVLLGVVLAFVCAIWPWTVVLAASATPLALRVASGRERNAQASRWTELHHYGSGDPLSWSGW